MSSEKIVIPNKNDFLEMLKNSPAALAQLDGDTSFFEGLDEDAFQGDFYLFTLKSDEDFQASLNIRLILLTILMKVGEDNTVLDGLANLLSELAATLPEALKSGVLTYSLKINVSEAIVEQL